MLIWSMISTELKSESLIDSRIMCTGLMGILSLSLYEVNTMNDEKEKRPDPKVLNAVIVAYEMVKGIHHKPEKEDAEKGEKGAEDESTPRRSE